MPPQRNRYNRNCNKSEPECSMYRCSESRCSESRCSESRCDDCECRECCECECDKVDLKIQKVGATEATVDQPLLYTVFVTNCSSKCVKDVVIRDVFGSPNVSFPLGVPTVSIGVLTVDYFAENSGTAVWTIPCLKPCAIAMLTANVTPTAAGKIINYAVILNYKGIRKDIDFTNNESFVVTNVTAT